MCCNLEELANCSANSDPLPREIIWPSRSQIECQPQLAATCHLPLNICHLAGGYHKRCKLVNNHAIWNASIMRCRFDLQSSCFACFLDGLQIANQCQVQLARNTFVYMLRQSLKISFNCDLRFRTALEIQSVYPVLWEKWGSTRLVERKHIYKMYINSQVIPFFVHL